jgi:iron complex transport system ATP-binding protein
MIETRGVWFAYDARSGPVLSDVSASFRSGSVTALLGPNGSGKTTLLLLFLGWLVPDKGEVIVAGKAGRSYSRRSLCHLIGWVPQDEPVSFELDLASYVLLGRAPHLRFLEGPGEEDLRAAADALRRVGLESRARKPVFALSSGERQLAALARALAQDSRALLLDEPLSHLDLSNTKKVLDVLRALRGDGKTLVFTTHDPNIAAALADEVVLLKDGRVAAAGSADEVLTAEALGSLYDLAVDVVRLDGRKVILPRLG